ncbi:MAG: helix-turn-helix domain-containing protein [Nitrososphaera sp.]
MLLLNGKTDATLKALRNLRLTEYESKAYFTLLVAGECKPKDIVRLAGIPQSKVYWVLQDLVEKKMAVQTQASPLKAKPVGLDVALAQFKAEKEAEFRRALSSAKYIGDVMASITKVAERYSGQFRIFESNRRKVRE